MPMYKTPPDSPVPSRPPSCSSSRSRSRSRSPSPRRNNYKPRSKSKPNTRSRSRSRSRAQSSRSRAVSRSRSSSRSSSSSSSDRRSRSKSKSRAQSKKPVDKDRERKYYSSSGNDAKLDTSKASMAKTSAVFLGSVAVATVCAHKFWPKGFIYGEKEEWEKEKKSFERKKKAVKEELEKAEGRSPGGGGGVGVGVGRSRSQSQSTTSTSTRELAYLDREYDQDRLVYRGDWRPVFTSSGRGGQGTVVKSEQEALVYRQDRGANGRETAVVIQRAEDYQSRSHNAPRLALPLDDDRDLVYKRSTREAGYADEVYLPPSTRNGHGHSRSRSAHTHSLPPRSPSPTTTTMAVAGSPVTAPDIRRQQLQIQQREKRDQPRDEYYLLPAQPSSSQGPLLLARSNSFSTPTSTTRDRDRDRENDRYNATSTKDYYPDEHLLPMASRRGGGGHGRAADHDRDRGRDRETAYVYRDRGRGRDERDVRVLDTYYDYNYR